MPRMIYDYTKSVLEKVSFDVELFMKELKKAVKKLLPYEVEHLKNWLIYFITQNPQLKPCLNYVMEDE